MQTPKIKQEKCRWILCATIGSTDCRSRSYSFNDKIDLRPVQTVPAGEGRSESVSALGLCSRALCRLAVHAACDSAQSVCSGAALVAKCTRVVVEWSVAATSGLSENESAHGRDNRSHVAGGLRPAHMTAQTRPVGRAAVPQGLV
jgi:hypothetical protein